MWGKKPFSCMAVKIFSFLFAIETRKLALAGFVFVATLLLCSS